ncbi:hypothetical protein EMCG_04357, partial [[Emmonsia] crescens]
MRTLEEGFREVIWEVKGMRREGERERERDRRRRKEGNFLKKVVKTQRLQKSRANTDIGYGSGNDDGGGGARGTAERWEEE